MCEYSEMRFAKVMATVFVLAAGLTPAVRGAPAGGAGRPMTTDRPDSTESPFTVEPGRVQLEMDLVRQSRDSTGGFSTRATELAPFNLRLGVTRDVELGVVLNPRQWERESAPGVPVFRRRGVGDLVLRAKRNWWGNDGGFSALGTIFDLKLPTASHGLGNGHVEGEIMLPVAFAPGGNWHAGFMTSLAAAHDGNHYDAWWRNSVTFCFEFAAVWEGVVEVTSATGADGHQATLNCALIRKLGPDLQVDVGANFGISRSAPDVVLFTGLSRRF
jgi:hypothetical protein